MFLAEQGRKTGRAWRDRGREGKRGGGERKDAGRPLMAGWFRYDCGSRLSELHMALCKVRQKKFWFRETVKQFRNHYVAKPWSFGQSHKGFRKSVSSLIN